MTYGVKINGTDTKTAYGLILCADINIGAAPLKETFVDVPGLDGSLNYSYALTGDPVFGDREITFTLFKAVDDTALETLRKTLANAYHGQEVTLGLPNDTSNHWTGVLYVGDISGYNSGKIPMRMRAHPYKSANTGSGRTL